MLQIVKVKAGETETTTRSGLPTCVEGTVSVISTSCCKDKDLCNSAAMAPASLAAVLVAMVVNLIMRQ